MSFLEVTAFLFDGFLISLLIFVVTLLCGVPLGLPIAFCSMSRSKVIRAISKVFVWIIRGTPLMLQIFAIYFAIPMFFGKNLDRMTATGRRRFQFDESHITSPLRS